MGRAGSREELKKSPFITAIGKNAYKTLDDLLLPATPADKKFEELVKVLGDRYVPASRFFAERFKFNRWYQAQGETIATFALALKHMALYAATPEETEETLTEVQETMSEAADSTAAEDPPEPLPRRSTRISGEPNS
ncbi:hypothetical protein HPB52_019868 [Rhipicephalus sanguineus]|uniref:Uncharacterized protein n=1 Tax=Rhipicephalus sanguineus TaxID=34632 RepID=A0A9D4Q024_RHISA|nr:hypothetical protein HPB52_019868 [Rhipicephalus sanguineus]